MVKVFLFLGILLFGGFSGVFGGMPTLSVEVRMDPSNETCYDNQRIEIDVNMKGGRTLAPKATDAVPNSIILISLPGFTSSPCDGSTVGNYWLISDG